MSNINRTPDFENQMVKFINLKSFRKASKLNRRVDLIIQVKAVLCISQLLLRKSATFPPAVACFDTFLVEIVTLGVKCG